MSDVDQRSSSIRISILPVEDEDDDLETLGLVQGVRRGFLDEVSHLDALKVEVASSGTRSGGLIVLIPEIVNAVVAQKDLLLPLFQASKDAIAALAKRKHVSAIEITMDGDSLRIEGADYSQADRLISIFEAKHLNKAQQQGPSPTVEITAVVSKAEQAALPEGSSIEEVQ